MWERIEIAALAFGFGLVLATAFGSPLLALRLHRRGKPAGAALLLNAGLTCASLVAALVALSFVADTVNDARFHAGGDYKPIFNGERKLGPWLLWFTALQILVGISNVVGAVLIARNGSSNSR